MADKKISGLNSATTPLDGTEVLPVVQSGTTKKVANNDLRPKQIQSNATSGVLQVAGPAAASTRVMTTPDANFSAARTDAGQTFQGVQEFYGNAGVMRLRWAADGGDIKIEFCKTDGTLLWDIGGGNTVRQDELSFRHQGTPVFYLDSNTLNAKVSAGNLVIGTPGKGIVLTSPNGLITKTLSIDNAGLIALI